MSVAIATNIVAVRFHKLGKLYHFDISDHPQLRPGDFVIVETTRGRQLGQIVGSVPPDKVIQKQIKPIKSPASARDLMMQKLWEAKEVAALIDCREAAAELGTFEGVKFIKAKYNYDGSLLTIMYTSEETTVNTTRLRRRLEQRFHTRVELHRIGARDAASMLGEYGACSGPRCCSTFLNEFSPISIKMAKVQGISLNPSEITGMCGRLRCCLIYEYEQYVEATKNLPKVGKRIGTPHGEGKVVSIDPLNETVVVEINEIHYQVSRAEIEHVEELRALQEKAAQACSREGLGGVCECGARIRKGPETSPTHIPQESVDQPETTRSTAEQGIKEEQPARQQSRRRSGRSRRPDAGKRQTKQ